MKGKKIITVLIIVNLVLVAIIYNLINKRNVNNKKQIIKEMTETEYEDNIKSLNKSHEEYANHIEESKRKIASALTDMGVTTSGEDTLDIMASNIRSISRENSVVSSAKIVAQLSVSKNSPRTYTTDKDYKLLLINITDCGSSTNPSITCNGGTELLNANSVTGYGRVTTAIYKDVSIGSAIIGTCYEGTQTYSINIFSLE